LTTSEKRWRNVTPQWTGPGPGEYESARRRETAPAAPGRAAAAEADLAEARRRKGGAAEPGPGSYNHMGAHYSGAAVKWVDAPHTGASSAFKAPPRRLNLAARAEAPGAGRYELGKV